LLVTPATKSKLRGQEGIVESAWVPIVPFLRGGRAPGEAMAPMCDQGFGPSTGALLPPRARAKSEIREHTEGCPRRLPVEMDSEQGNMADDGTRES
jgi:hypothetical protein